MNSELTKEQARALVEAEIAQTTLPDGDLLVICDEATLECRFGWVFFYDSKRHTQTGDFRDTVVGNAPLIVNRYDGSIVHTGTARPIAEYIAEYEASLARDAT